MQVYKVVGEEPLRPPVNGEDCRRILKQARELQEARCKAKDEERESAVVKYIATENWDVAGSVGHVHR